MPMATVIWGAAEIMNAFMNDLAFRAWDTNRKIMVEVETINLKKMTGWFCWNEGSMVRARDVRSFSLIDGGILMMSVGRRDKNHRMIFDQDILLTYAGIRKVVWNSGSFYLTLVNSKTSYLWELTHENTEMAEIVGNPYENPELLK